MKEVLLHYIWQHQLFDKHNLLTERGEEINIIKPGFLNHESGPDFLQAQLKIGGMVWFGAIEIHVVARDWRYHHHQHDPAYDQVILHVVWQYDAEATRKDGTQIQTLQLSNRVAPHLLQSYQQLTSSLSKKSLSCSRFLPETPSIYKISSLEKAAFSRLSRKSKEIFKIYAQNNNDWHQTALQVFATAYGFKTNATAFSQLGAKVSIRHLLKERQSFDNLAGILVSTSGLGNESKISDRLSKSAQHMAKKYGIAKFRMQPHEFKHFPVRPANAPLLRILQLSAFIYQQADLFQLLSSASQDDDIYQLFEEANKTLKDRRPLRTAISRMGKESMQVIIINSVVPFQFALGQSTNNDNLVEKSLSFLEKMPPEKNRYYRIFKKEGFALKSALDSQGAIEQHRFYCQQSKCLNCPVGNYIMKNHDLVVI